MRRLLVLSLQQRRHFSSNVPELFFLQNMETVANYTINKAVLAVQDLVSNVFVLGLKKIIMIYILIIFETRPYIQ
jgi:hypothetical protein